MALNMQLRLLISVNTRSSFKEMLTIFRAYFSHLLGAVPARSAHFDKYNNLFSVKTFKTTCRLGGCSIPNALNLKELGVKTHDCALLSDFLPFFVIPYGCLYSLE